MKRTVAVALSAACLLAAAPVASAPRSWRCADEERTDSPRYRVRESDGLVDVAADRWRCAYALRNDRVLIIRFDLNNPCHGLERVKVRYLEERVVVTLFEGRDDSEQICTQQVVDATVRIELKEPRDGRRIVDGARR